jgi:hypothetical protein
MLNKHTFWAVKKDSKYYLFNQATTTEDFVQDINSRIIYEFSPESQEREYWQSMGVNVIGLNLIEWA